MNQAPEPLERITRPRHVHSRDRYCSAMFPAPLEPKKAWPRFLFAWSRAIHHESTFNAFVTQYPDQFTSVTSADPVVVDIVVDEAFAPPPARQAREPEWPH